MDKKTTAQILELLKILKNRPSMIIPYPNSKIDFTVLDSYLCGYFNGIQLITGKDIDKNMSTWLAKKINRGANVHWTAHIEMMYGEISNEELKIKLLDTAEAYFTENPDWYL